MEKQIHRALYDERKGQFYLPPGSGQGRSLHGHLPAARDCAGRTAADSPAALAYAAGLVFMVLAVIRGVRGLAAVTEIVGSPVCDAVCGTIRPVVDLGAISLLLVLFALSWKLSRRMSNSPCLCGSSQRFCSPPPSVTSMRIRSRRS